MSKERANLFKGLRQPPATEPEIEPETEAASEDVTEPVPEVEPEEPVKAAPESPPKRKRGRPATGKRSDPSWIGRTFYVRRETDLNVEGELFQLKRQGIEVDKSELVDSLLNAWVIWRQSDKANFPMDKILPKR